MSEPLPSEEEIRQYGPPGHPVAYELITANLIALGNARWSEQSYSAAQMYWNAAAARLIKVTP